MRRESSDRPRRATRHRAVAAISTAQYGAITRTQLTAIGLGPAAVDHWLRAGKLHLVHRGVYLLGHTAEHPRAREMAAVLACAPAALLSHSSAAYLWGLLRAKSRPAPIEVSIIGRGPGSKRGLRIHGVRALTTSERTRLGPIPITTPRRTLLDLAARCGSQIAERALAEAELQRLVTRHSMTRYVEAMRGKPGTRMLREILADGPALTRSEAEDLLLRIVRRARLPAPRTNVRVGAFSVDALWARERLVVEVDGFRFHGGRQAFERDHVRDAELAAMGYLVIRVTWRRLVQAPEAVVRQISRALRARQPSPA